MEVPSSTVHVEQHHSQVLGASVNDVTGKNSFVARRVPLKDDGVSERLPLPELVEMFSHYRPQLVSYTHFFGHLGADVTETPLESLKWHKKEKRERESCSVCSTAIDDITVEVSSRRRR